VDLEEDADVEIEEVVEAVEAAVEEVAEAGLVLHEVGFMF